VWSYRVYLYTVWSYRVYLYTVWSYRVYLYTVWSYRVYLYTVWSYRVYLYTVWSYRVYLYTVWSYRVYLYTVWSYRVYLYTVWAYRVYLYITEHRMQISKVSVRVTHPVARGSETLSQRWCHLQHKQEVWESAKEADVASLNQRNYLNRDILTRWIISTSS